MRNEKYDIIYRKRIWLIGIVTLTISGFIFFNITPIAGEESERFLNPQEEKMQISPERLEKISTKDLLEEILYTPMTCTIMAYSGEEGFVEFRKGFNGLREFMKRKDAGEAAWKKYVEFDPYDVPDEATSVKRGRYSNSFLVLEQILSQPEILEQLKGKEKLILKTAIEKIERCIQYNKDKEFLYGMSLKYGMFMLGKVLLQMPVPAFKVWILDEDNKKSMSSNISFTDEQCDAILKIAKEYASIQ